MDTVALLTGIELNNSGFSILIQNEIKLFVHTTEILKQFFFYHRVYLELCIVCICRYMLCVICIVYVTV